MKASVPPLCLPVAGLKPCFDGMLLGPVFVAVSLVLAPCAGAADKSQKPGEIFATPAAQPDSETRTAVQITELGCMRVLLLLDDTARDLEKLAAQRLSDVDFRLFPAARGISGRVTSEAMRVRGAEEKADLVFHATVSSREKSKLQDFVIFEGEATVQIYSPISGELLVTHTSRTSGVRNVDRVEAERSARERALDAASREAITKSLEKAHKILVYRADLEGVRSHNHLLALMEHIQKEKGVYHVRQLNFDAEKKVARIEIVASPKSESFWRAHVENMPATKVVTYVQNKEVRDRFPSWFSTGK
jgi:hypothetical protein